MKKLDPTPRSIHEIVGLLDDRNLPDPTPDGVPCCAASAMLGPERCTCWENVHNTEQAPPRFDVPIETRDRLCRDCAFRPGSPERTSADAADCDADDLAVIVADATQSFWCHDGLRSIVALQHPGGMRIAHDPVDGVVGYDPLIVDGVPYRADGRPGLRCAGLAAARRAAARGGSS